jgi:hypothetical protein
MPGQSEAAAAATGWTLNHVHAGWVVTNEIHIRSDKAVHSRPRLRARLSALRKTSGITTAEPRFTTTPCESPPMTDTSRWKFTITAAPIAAPSALGCM